jgi:hypothetical protein
MLIIVPNRLEQYDSGIQVKNSSLKSLSTKKNTTGTKSNALYAATHRELNIDTPEKSDAKAKPSCFYPEKKGEIGREWRVSESYSYSTITSRNTLQLVIIKESCSGGIGRRAEVQGYSRRTRGRPDL